MLEINQCSARVVCPDCKENFTIKEKTLRKLSVKIKISKRCKKCEEYIQMAKQKANIKEEKHNDMISNLKEMGLTENTLHLFIDAQLNENQAKALIMRFEKGMTYVSIGKLMQRTNKKLGVSGVSGARAESIIFYGARKLRHHVNKNNICLDDFLEIQKAFQ